MLGFKLIHISKWWRIYAAVIVIIIGTKPSSEPILTCQLYPSEQIFMTVSNHNEAIFIHDNAFVNVACNILKFHKRICSSQGLMNSFIHKFVKRILRRCRCRAVESDLLNLPYHNESRMAERQSIPIIWMAERQSIPIILQKYRVSQHQF